jgi:hypothetical protein
VTAHNIHISHQALLHKTQHNRLAFLLIHRENHLLEPSLGQTKLLKQHEHKLLRGQMGDIPMEVIQQISGSVLKGEFYHIQSQMLHNLYQDLQHKVICFVCQLNSNNIINCLVVDYSFCLRLGKFKFVLLQLSEENCHDFACCQSDGSWKQL